jgi:hypothetical protein
VSERDEYAVLRLLQGLDDFLARQAAASDRLKVGSEATASQSTGQPCLPLRQRSKGYRPCLSKCIGDEDLLGPPPPLSQSDRPLSLRRSKGWAWRRGGRAPDDINVAAVVPAIHLPGVYKDVYYLIHEILDSN